MGSFHGSQMQLRKQSDGRESSASGRFPVTIAQSLANVVSEQEVQGMTSGSTSTRRCHGTHPGPDTDSHMDVEDVLAQFSRGPGSSQSPPLTPARDRPDTWESRSHQLRNQEPVRDDAENSSASGP